jgi:phytoene dehydrogenase-like protein
MKQEKETNKAVQNWGFYSRVLQKPFDTISELEDAEAAYYAELKAKEDKAATKKADALVVEEAFKVLNKTRREFKDDIKELTDKYRKDLVELKEKFDTSKELVYKNLSKAEDDYSAALKTFTDKYPEGYHITLKDGDFETTISSAKYETGSESATHDKLFGDKSFLHLFDPFLFSKF